MKSVAVLLVAILVVAGFAVSGSRAQPVPAVGVAAQQCQPARPTGAPCRPLIGALSAELERDMLGDDALGGNVFGDNDAGAGDPEWHWRDLVARVVVVVASWFAEHFGGRYTPDGPGIDPETIFDVTR